MKSFTRLFKGAMLMGLTAAMVVPSFAGRKRVLVEDQTGAWCGWCVVGNQAIEDMKKQYGDDFIAVGLHNGDAMATQFETQLATDFQATNYPNGFINRASHTIPSVGTTKKLHPVYWPQVIEPLIGQEAQVDVAVVWNLDKTSGDLTATVTADVLQAQTQQLAFNLYVMEDALTGTGNQWDQQNYVSGNQDYKNHPYYTKPSVIKNYYHMHVLRDMLGGTYGTNGSFPAAAAAGTYTHEFTANIKSKAKNLNNVYIIAVVHNTVTKEIMNAIEVGKKEFKTAKVNIAGEKFGTSTGGAAITKKVTVTNPTNMEVPVKLSIDESTSFIPNGWQVGLSEDAAVLPANGSLEIDVDINPAGGAGFSWVNVNAVPDLPADEYLPETATATGYTMSDKTKSGVFFGLDDSFSPLYTAILSSGLLKNYGVFPADAEIMDHYNLGDQLDVAVVSVNQQWAFTEPTADDLLNFSSDFIEAGKDMFLTTTLDPVALLGNVQGVPTPTQAAKDFFQKTLGVNATAFVNLVQGNQLYNLAMKGLEGDDVTGDITAENLNSSYSQSSPYYNQYVSLLKVEDDSKATAVMTATVNGSTEENSVTAVKVENGDSRVFLTTFTMGATSIANRQMLTENALTWIQGTSSVDEVAGDASVFTMQLGPNPVVDNSNLNYVVAGNSSKAVSLTLINSLGQPVRELVNQSLAPGEYNMDVNATGLAAGKYMVVANVGGYMTQLPVVINK